MFWKRPRLKRQIDAIFGWLSGIATEQDAILIEFPDYKGLFCFEFPLRLGDSPKKIKTKKEETFIVRSPHAGGTLSGKWFKIFSSSELEVYESGSRAAGRASLRWGLGDDEKEEALKMARGALEKFLLSGELPGRGHPGAFSYKLHNRTALDVALWFGGHLRGSAVIENRHLGEGITEAALMASRDIRFKPLSYEELADTRIEITLMHDLRLPLSTAELKRGVIYPEKGYLLRQKTAKKHSNILQNVRMLRGAAGRRDEGRRGWFLPEVHNVRRFRNLEEFLGDLAHSKAGLSPDAHKNADIFIFEVDDFIEPENHNGALTLRGPVVDLSANNEFFTDPGTRNPSDFSAGRECKIGKVYSTSRPVPSERSEEWYRDKRIFAPDSLFVDKRLRAAADWLCRIQEPDGNLPPIINPLTGLSAQINWPRLAFTAWALAEFGKAVNEEKCVRAAEKSFEYLKARLLGDSELRIKNYELALAYFGRLSLTLDKLNEARSAAKNIFERLPGLPFGAITFSQIAGFFNVLPQARTSFYEAAQKMTKVLEDNFRRSLKNKESLSLAVWAEAVNAFDKTAPEFAAEILDWLKSQQLPSGAFPESTDNEFAYTPTPNLVWGYTRGTGKIFEVLALDSGKNREAIEKALAWLLSMQYDEENTYFVPEEFRPKILGAFRHDYFNPEAWIDAAGHVLLGGARGPASKLLWK